MTRSLIRVTAGGLSLANAMIHAGTLYAHFDGALYMGILFVFAVIFLSMLGLALLQPPFSSPAERMGRLTRAAGVLLMIGMIVGYVLTRTVGLPGYEAPWENVGITTLALEALTAVLLLADMGDSRTEPRERA